MNQVAILAGGLGTRMLPRTEATPKFLLPVAGRPFGEWLLERVARSGFDEALILVGHLGAMIEDAIGDGARFGLRVRYASDGPELLGTAGALRRAVNELDREVLVTYGDSYLPFDYMAPLADLRGHPEALGTMAVYKNEGRFDRSNTVVRGDRVLHYDKKATRGNRRFDHIDYGATALRRDVIAAIPAGKAVGLDAIQEELASRGRLRALPVSERFYEIGSEVGFADLEKVLISRP